MADSAILAAGGAAAPLSYKVPGAAVIRIKQVHVVYADNTAGADWLPMVRIVSDSSHTMGQAADQAVKVTAGDDAAVTFHPGVKHAAATAGSFQWCHVIVGASVPSGSVALPQTGTAMPIIDLTTSDPASYAQVDATHWKIKQVPQSITGLVVVDGGGLTTLNGDVYCIANSGGGSVFGAYGQNTHKLLVEWYAATLTSAADQANNWRAFAAGADTHQFDMHIWYGAVY